MSRRGGYDEDDDAPPWLAPAEPDLRGDTVIPGRRFGLWVVLLGGLLLLVVGLVYAMIARPEDEGPVYAADGEVPLIRAPDAPFKVRPSDPGGLDLEGGNQTAFEAAGGLDPGGDLNFDALPEEPIDRSEIAAAAPARPASPAPAAPPADADAAPGPKLIIEAPKPAPKPEAKPAKPEAKTAPKNETKEPVATSDGGSYSLQLGAFSSESKANAAWKSFTGRYSYLADLGKSVIALERDGEKLYRLRATGIGSRSQADNLCGRLRAAGDQCSVID